MFRGHENAYGVTAVTDQPKVLLLDVGGTLWSDYWSVGEDGDAVRAKQLEGVFPRLDRTTALQAVIFLNQMAETVGPEHRQDTSARLHEGCVKLGLAADAESIAKVRVAMAVPVDRRVDFFPGVPELLSCARSHGLTCVIVSNTTVRTAADYREDFAILGVNGLVDHVVTSVDVGYKKPNPAMFNAALSFQPRAPGEAVMIGNSEANDILPAKHLGMRTIRVAIEEALPASSAADTVAASLGEAMSALDSWSKAAIRTIS